MPEKPLSKDELKRYSRHLLLPEIGLEGQQKLKNSRVLVVGAGGLGCPTLMYLAAAGIGTIGIIDDDIVDESNLQRQVLFTTDDIGKPKAATAASRLSRQNPHIQFEVFNERLTSKNALKTMESFEVVVDGTDNFATRYLVNDACVLQKKPNIHGAIYKFEGQVAVFNYQYQDGSAGPNYRDLFPTPPPTSLAPNCAEAGVLGVLPGLIGTIQANETIKVLTGIGEPLAGKLFFLDALSMETRIMSLPVNPAKPAIKLLENYEAFCQTGTPQKAINEISVHELQSQLINSSEEVHVVDVREVAEFESDNIGGLNIPLRNIEDRHAEIPQTGTVVLVCKSGVRSALAMEKLLFFGHKNLVNLQGGLSEWRKLIDPNITII